MSLFIDYTCFNKLCTLRKEIYKIILKYDITYKNNNNQRRRKREMK